MSRRPADVPTPPTDVLKRLARHNQEHLLRWWGALSPAAREGLLAEVEGLPLEALDELVAELVGPDRAAERIDPARVKPVEVRRLPRTDADRAAWRQAAAVGEEVLAAGEAAVVLVAGGQGTRLGFDGPKGTFPIGPVSGASLFEIHAAKLVALSRRHGRLIPLYVMTSPENQEATGRFFREHGNFGLDHVRFFVQGRMPAVDRSSGRVMLAEKGRVALSPDGHGGAIAALAAPGPGGSPSGLDEMRERGVRTIFYFQVDNPLVRIAEPAFLGLHRQAGADISFKVVEKIDPAERVGLVVEVDGRPRVIEYSDLAPELAERRQPVGSLELWAGSIAIHAFERPFLERLAEGGGQLPYHRAFKRVPHIDEEGRHVAPSEPNAVKFERFIFDALPLARRWALVETDRAVEFEPLKNATGPDSPATVRQRMSDLFAGWLEGAGATVPRRPDGSVPFGIEISPLYALDSGELKAKLAPGLVVEGPLYLR